MADYFVLRNTTVTMNRGTVNVIPLAPGEEVLDITPETADPYVGRVVVTLKNHVRDVALDEDGNPKLPYFYNDYQIDYRRIH